MNKLVIAFAFLLTLPTFAQDEISVKTQIESATVFLRGAQITRKGTKNVTSGTHTLKVAGLSPNINANTIQMKGTGAITILSVKHQQNYMKENEKPRRIRSLEDSLKVLNRMLEYHRGLKDIYNQERQMILANKSVHSNEVGLDVEDLEDVADFYRDRLSSIMEKMLDLNEKERDIQKEVNKVNNQLRERNARWMRNTSEILIEVAANKSTNAKLEVSYLVNNAGWTPTYDIRAKDNKSPVTMAYKAHVWQNTGIDWKDVNLLLSTGNPSQSGTKPSMSAWLLRFQPQYSRQSNKSKGRPKRVAAESNRAFDYADMPMPAESADELLVEDPITTTAAYTEVSESQTNINFIIKIPYTIPTDGKQHLVQIKDFELPATYEYYAAPKLDNDAFLLARATGWDGQNLLSGSCNIYYEGTYVGQSYIDTRQTRDTLNLSLGRDKSVVIKRERIKDFTKSKVIGSSKKETIGMQIEVRNTKSTAIDIMLEDQIPVSTNKDIEVELIESSGAKHNEKTGFLKWQVKLAPSESKTLIFKYSVKYPKDQLVNL